ncbi:MAG: ComEC/Rec2 family competence protein [Bacteroidales bacterium]
MPLLRLLLPFVAGIVLVLKFSLSVAYYYPVGIGIFLLMVLFVEKYFLKYSMRWTLSVLVFAFFVSAGAFLTDHKMQKVRPISLPDEALLMAEVISDPKETENAMAADILVNAYKHNDEWFASQGKAKIYFQKDSLSEKLIPGSLIGFKPEFDSISNSGNPGEFDYSRYMAYHMIASSAYLKSGSWQIIDRNAADGIRQKMLQWRNKLLDVYRKAGLKNDEFAVAAALSLGYKDKLQDEIRHAYSASGAMHVLAVSGLHVGIIFVVLQFLLSPMKKTARLSYLRVFLIVGAIWFYAMLTGLSPSVTRAAVMFSFISFGSLFKQHVNIYNILAASALVTLVFNPFVIAQLGFWLSYLAVLSIVTFFKPIYSLISCKYIITDKLWALVAVSVAAQIGTAPLTILFFKQFSNYFILTNIAVIPIVTVIVYLAIFVFVVSAMIPAMAVYAGKALAFFVSLLNESVFFIEKIPGAVAENLYITPFQMVLLYVFIITVAIWFLGNKRRFVLPALLSLIVFISAGIVRDYKNTKNKTLLVYNMRNQTAINCIVGKDNVMFTDFAYMEKEDVSDRMSDYWLTEGVEKEKYVNLENTGGQYILSNVMTIDNPHIFLKDLYLGLDSVRCLIIRDDRFENKIAGEKLELDYIILSEGAHISAERIAALFSFQKVIIDSSVPWYKREELIEGLKKHNIKYYDLVKDGAFIVNLQS